MANPNRSAEPHSESFKTSWAKAIAMNLNRYGAQHTLRAVNFICNAPQAQSVSLVGDFNHWNAGSHPMKQMPYRREFALALLLFLSMSTAFGAQAKSTFRSVATGEPVTKSLRSRLPIPSPSPPPSLAAMVTLTRSTRLATSAPPASVVA